MEEKYPPWYKVRQEYCDQVGDVRELMLAEIFRDFGFKVKVNRTRGLDLSLYDDGKLVALIEVTNEWKKSYYDKPILKEKVSSFRKHHHRKAKWLWICSFEDSVDTSLLRAYGVEVVPLGYQTLEEKDYQWFKQNGQSDGREPTTTAYHKTKAVLETLAKDLIKPN